MYLFRLPLAANQRIASLLLLVLVLVLVLVFRLVLLVVAITCLGWTVDNPQARIVRTATVLMVIVSMVNMLSIVDNLDMVSKLSMAKVN